MTAGQSPIRVTGVDQLRVLGKELTKAGRTDLKVEIKKEIQRYVRDNHIKEAIAQSALDTLPSSGGEPRKPRLKGKRKDGKPRKARPRSRKKRIPLNQYVAKHKIVTKVNLAGKSIGVRIIGSKAKSGKQVDLESINKGEVRHPTYGHKPWVAQKVEPGFFDKPLEGEVADNFRKAVFAAIGNIRARLMREGSGGSKAA